MKRDANGSKIVFVPDIITPGQLLRLKAERGPIQSAAALDARRAARCHSLFSKHRSGYQEIGAGSFCRCRGLAFRRESRRAFLIRVGLRCTRVGRTISAVWLAPMARSTPRRAISGKQDWSPCSRDPCRPHNYAFNRPPSQITSTLALVGNSSICQSKSAERA